MCDGAPFDPDTAPCGFGLDRKRSRFRTARERVITRSYNFETGEGSLLRPLVADSGSNTEGRRKEGRGARAGGLENLARRSVHIRVDVIIAPDEFDVVGFVVVVDDAVDLLFATL